jgi:hypothetical protein
MLFNYRSPAETERSSLETEERIINKSVFCLVLPATLKDVIISSYERVGKMNVTDFIQNVEAQSLYKVALERHDGGKFM